MLCTWYADSLSMPRTRARSPSSPGLSHADRRRDGHDATTGLATGPVRGRVKRKPTMRHVLVRAPRRGPAPRPDAMDVVMTPDGPRSSVRTAWPKQASLGAPPGPIVYELHVRGFGTTFAGCAENGLHTSPISAST